MRWLFQLALAAAEKRTGGETPAGASDQQVEMFLLPAKGFGISNLPDPGKCLFVIKNYDLNLAFQMDSKQLSAINEWKNSHLLGIEWPEYKQQFCF